MMHEGGTGGGLAVGVLKVQRHLAVAVSGCYRRCGGWNSPKKQNALPYLDAEGRFVF